MRATEGQKLVRLEDCISETHLVGMIRQEMYEIAELNNLEFVNSFDDLDYLVFTVLTLPSGNRIALIRHQNSPSPGTEICVQKDISGIEEIIEEALTTMNLSRNDLTWVNS